MAITAIQNYCHHLNCISKLQSSLRLEAEVFLLGCLKRLSFEVLFLIIEPIKNPTFMFEKVRRVNNKEVIFLFSNPSDCR